MTGKIKAQAVQGRAAGESRRMHHVDAARALFLLLGIPFHIGMIAVFNRSPAIAGFSDAPLIVFSMTFIHAFRMFAFFLLSGYFAAMVRERRGRHTWLADRMARIGVPLLGSLATLGVVQHYFHRALLSEAPGGIHGLPLAFDHLWFLCVLLGFVVTFFLFPGTWLPRRDGVAGNTIGRALCLEGRLWPLALALLALWGFAQGGLEDALPRRRAFEIDLGVQYLMHAPAFAIGVLAWHLRIGERLFDLAGARLPLLAGTLIAAYLLLSQLFRPILGLSRGLSMAENVLGNLIELPTAYVLSLMALRLLARVAARPSALVAFLVEGAMAIYLFHMAFVMLAVAWLPRLPLVPEAQWLIGSAVVLGLSIGAFLIARRNALLSLVFCGKAMERPRPALPFPA
ncbi:acyltransferase family protein [Novosphingobium sp. KCTC 2891]|uniref:acyltransferase family protein n=1 Tax=Novosphingobium sp. KCTC 2891 TaxID=2989730 RepID=UPI002221C99E|nr:acyltransferase family protein [Novosphingobium sp. KCTC 2891]MCW1382838.1 acyltransferase family protein [Novosphingobium sp. KCTC 2891]